MKNTLAISAIILIAVIMVMGAVSPVMATKDDNNGSNGCAKSNPNSKACEKNPNSKKTVNLRFHDTENNPISGAQCTIYDAAFSGVPSTVGTTDSNDIVSGVFPLEVEVVGVVCIYGDDSSQICQTTLEGFNTNIDLELGQYDCPVGI